MIERACSNVVAIVFAGKKVTMVRTCHEKG